MCILIPRAYSTFQNDTRRQGEEANNKGMYSTTVVLCVCHTKLTDMADKLPCALPGVKKQFQGCEK